MARGLGVQQRGAAPQPALQQAQHHGAAERRAVQQIGTKRLDRGLVQRDATREISGVHRGGERIEVLCEEPRFVSERAAGEPVRELDLES